MRKLHESHGESKATRGVSNPAKLLRGYMMATGETNCRTISEALGIPLRTVQRLKLEVVAADANDAISGVSVVAADAISGVSDAPKTPNAPDMASRACVEDNNLLTSLVDRPEEDIPPTPKRKRSISKSQALEAFHAYNATAERCGLPQAAKFTPDRERKIAARLKDYGLDGWMQAIGNIEKSSFLTGGTDHGFRADLDFVCQAKSFGKLHDGGYGNGRHVAMPQELGPFDWSKAPAWMRDEYEIQKARHC